MSTVAERRRTEPRKLRQMFRRDLDWIVMKAIDKDRNRRYGSANELAADLQRHLEYEPVIAGPPGAGYRLRKLLRRYRGQAVAGAAILLTLIIIP